MNDIGQRIKQIRKSNDLTQIEFSKLIGISQGTPSEIEKGKSKPAVETLQQLSKIFQTDLNWLVMDDFEKNSFSNLQVEMLVKVRELDSGIQNEILEFIEFKLTRLINKTTR
ncbi:helix-turn-helix domain-containing protein [Paenibacillus planticolens]|uniref:helix-turn-helix domain-containing protein n=1 Tax=Paenibacillus planticolens TaxID=2654976 RepID=UPI0014931920|nr:helix-turn-helix transcriptional regulator [Paenibacillus planticolens]